MRSCLVFLFFLFTQAVFSTQNKVDSLKGVILSAGKDTIKLNALLKLSIELKSVDPNLSLHYAEEALKLSKTLGFKKGIGRSLNRLGLHYKNQGNLINAAKYFKEAEKTFSETGDKALRIQTLNNIGKVYTLQNNYPPAIETYHHALQIAEEIKDNEGIAACYTLIGNVFHAQKNLVKAREAYIKAIEFSEESGDKKALAYAYGNLGGTYYEEKNYKEALKNYDLSYKYSVSTNDLPGIGSVLSNMGAMYTDQGKFKEARKYFNEAIDIFRKINNDDALLAALNNSAICNYYTGNFQEAEKDLNEGIVLALSTRNHIRTYEIYNSFAEMNALRKDYETGYRYIDKVLKYKDTLYDNQTSEKILELEAKFTNEKQVKEIALLTKEKEVNDLRRVRQQTLFYFLSALLLLITILVIVIYNRYRIKRKAHIEISKQKEKVEEANIQIKEKNREITDSINYAKRIQEAILPSHQSILSFLPGCLIVYQPKDIVSGDFYWFAHKNNKVLIAAADCTGHGVPGALMSMIGNDKLQQAVTEKDLEEPSEILKELDQNLIHVLKQKESFSTADGMDIALLSIDLTSNTIVFSGANRPLYKFSGNDFFEIKGTKLPIGGSSYGNKDFHSNTFKASKGDTLYIFSDGFPDQFGGENGKKFTSSRFKTLLGSIQHLTMEEQQLKLEKVFKEWQGNKEQVDDVLVIGIRL